MRADELRGDRDAGRVAPRLDGRLAQTRHAAGDGLAAHGRGEPAVAVPRRALHDRGVVAPDEDGERALDRRRGQVESVEGVVAALVADHALGEQAPEDRQALLGHVGAPRGAQAREEPLELLAVRARPDAEDHAPARRSGRAWRPAWRGRPARAAGGRSSPSPAGCGG